MKELSPEQRNTRKRILEISHEARLSHLGSCLSAVDIIDAVYQIKKNDEIFILSGGHAAVAWYVILEKYCFLKDVDITKLHIHPDRNPKIGIEVSTGSLGQGLPIALGIALADRSKNVYCMITDGETNEGSVWESLRIASEQKMDNLKVICNANGWGAYDPIRIEELKPRFQVFGWRVIEVDGHNVEEIKRALLISYTNIPSMIFAKTNVNQFSFLKDQDAHYRVMSDEDFRLALRELNERE